MRLKRFYARNTLTFGPSGFEWADIRDQSVVVGPNASGKTNVLRLISIVGEAFYQAGPIDSRSVGRLIREPDSLIEVTVAFNQEEKAAISRLLLTSARMEQLNWPGEKIDPAEAERIGQELLSRRSGVFDKLVSRDFKFCVAGQVNRAFPYQVYAELGTDGTPLYITTMGVSAARSSPQGWGNVSPKREFFEIARKRNPGLAAPGPAAKPASAKQLTAASGKIPLNWLVGRLNSVPGRPNILSPISVNLAEYDNRYSAIYPDLTSLRAFLDKRGWEGQQIGMIDLLGLVYRTSVVRVADIRTRPGDRPLADLPSGANRAAEIDGSQLAPVLFAIKNSADYQLRAEFYALKSQFKKFTGVDVDVALETALDANNNTTYLASVRAAGPGYEIPIAFLAAGWVELLTFLFALRGVWDGVLLLDEPALNLHPTKQRQLFEEMVATSARLGNQLIVVTHSPQFVGVDLLTKIVRLSLNEKGDSTMNRFKAADPWAKAQATKNLERYPKLLAALFARGVVLVEGDQEEAALPVWFGKCEGAPDFSALNIAFISVHSETAFETFSRVLDAWGIPLRVLGDGHSRPFVAPFEERGVTYPQHDFSDILRTYCSRELSRAIRNVGASGHEKDPAVATLVAEGTPPPPPIRKLWRAIRSFVRAPS